MEEKHPLIEMGNRIIKIRKLAKQNQIEFYRSLFPEKDLEDENIKKKMNAIENGKYKKADYELLFRIHEKYDISLDYLFGYETEYPNYENREVCHYTGLSSDAVWQLHYWKEWKEKECDEIKPDMMEEEIRKILHDMDQKNESKWILEIASKLLEKKNEKHQVADLSILFDIYMLTLDPPETVFGVTEEVSQGKGTSFEKLMSVKKIDARTLSFSDQMNENHPLDIGKINQQIWKDRLMKDIDLFVEQLKNSRLN